MNETACAFVCAIFSTLCLILFGYMLKTGDVSFMSLATVSAAAIVLLSGLALVCRYM